MTKKNKGSEFSSEKPTHLVGEEGSIPDFLKELDTKPKTCGASFQKVEDSNEEPAGMCNAKKPAASEPAKTCTVEFNLSDD